MIRKISKIILISIFLSFSQSCRILFDSSPEEWPAFEPRPLVGVSGFPPATSIYGKAFRDGCGAAWKAVTVGLPSDTGPQAMDSIKASSDPDYRSGWWDGFEQCTYIVDWDVV